MSVQTLDYKSIRIEMNVETQVEATFRLHACEKEPWTVGFIEAAAQQFPGAIFWDVGANVGSYALLAAKLGLKVVAIEPSYENYRALCRNLALNNLLGEVIALSCAASDKNGFDWFHYAGGMHSGAALHILGGDQKQSFHKQQVMVWTLDFVRQIVGFPGPQFVKIDVDGGELAVIKGGQEFFKSADTIGLLIEMRLSDEKEIVVLLGDMGWRISGRFDERGGKKISGVAYGAFVRP